MKSHLNLLILQVVMFNSGDIASNIPRIFHVDSIWNVTDAHQRGAAEWTDLEVRPAKNTTRAELCQE